VAGCGGLHPDRGEVVPHRVVHVTGDGGAILGHRVRGLRTVQPHGLLHVEPTTAQRHPHRYRRDSGDEDLRERGDRGGRYRAQ
jgi:hypothetical protein